jgi:hypothetical protein
MLNGDDLVGSAKIDEDLHGMEEEDLKVMPRRIDESLARHAPVSQARPSGFRTLFTLAVIAIFGAVINYKTESAPIGYCDTNSNTNNALEQLKAKRKAVEACNRENRTLLYLPPLAMDSSRDGEAVDETPCPPPPLLPFWHPTMCTPCPDHASCTQDSVTCDTGYLLRPHFLLFFLPPSSSPSKASLVPPTTTSAGQLVWKVISATTDGLPGVGAVGLPSRCVEDPKRKRNIGALGKTIEAMLGQERGKRLCYGKVDEVIEGGEAQAWGVKLEMLRQALKQKAPVSATRVCR